jgi:aerobic-type carbon monoxide dehydrogenase small subunit (CoxS/CutS family)
MKIILANDSSTVEVSGIAVKSEILRSNEISGIEIQTYENIHRRIIFFSIKPD